MPRVSVVIASYNHEAFIGATLDSVLAQTYRDFEIVVTDDGSADGSAAVVAGYDDPRIRLRSFPQNQGACAALNDAIGRAEGELIAVLNSDDLFHPHKLARQVAFLDANPDIGAVFAYPRFIDETGAPFQDERHKDASVFYVENRSRHAWLRHFFRHGNCLCHPTLLIRRSCYNAVGLYDPRLAQVPDLDMWIRLAMAFDIHVLPEPLIDFRIRSDNMNASGARPEVLVRDAWENGRILESYRRLSPEDFSEVFQEAPPQDVELRLAQLACGSDRYGYRCFGLGLWHEVLGRRGGDYAAYIRETGKHDLFGRLASQALHGSQSEAAAPEETFRPSVGWLHGLRARLGL